MSTGDPAEPIETPRAQRIEDFRMRWLPVIVWSAAALAVVGILWNRQTRHDHVGIAEARAFEISSPIAGRLATVHVKLNERVAAGDVVATLDDKQVQAMLATSEATIRKLQGDLESGRVTHRQSLAELNNDQRRFVMDEEDRRLEVLGLRVEFETRRIDVEREALEARRTRQLCDAGLASEQEAQEAEFRHQEVRRRVEETERLLSAARAELMTSEVRRLDVERDQPGLSTEKPMLLPLHGAIEVELRVLDEIRQQREALTLRSPVAGQVTLVPCSDGQAVTAGEAVAVVTELTVREIVAYLSEEEASPIAADAPALVASRNRPGRTGESVVLRVGDGIQQLPPRLWRDPRVPLYGRAVVVAAVPGMDLVPGELVSVAFP